VVKDRWRVSDLIAVCRWLNNLMSYYRRADSIQSLTLDNDNNGPRALNNLQYNNLLERVGCGYLPDYQVIICKSMKDGNLCHGYALPLENVMAHCHTTATLKNPAVGGYIQFNSARSKGCLTRSNVNSCKIFSLAILTLLLQLMSFGISNPCQTRSLPA
jgi:hypothetical protein